jgi:hypothetical protein
MRPTGGGAPCVAGGVGKVLGVVVVLYEDGRDIRPGIGRAGGVRSTASSRILRRLELTEIAAWPATIGRTAISERERTL